MMTSLQTRDDMDMGMTTSGPSGFLKTNQAIAHDYWFEDWQLLQNYIYDSLGTKNLLQYTIEAEPLLLENRCNCDCADAEAIYPQPLYFIGKFTQHLTPPPVGRCLFIIAYWALIMIALWKDSILTPESTLYAYYWEKVAFRAAWVSVTQLPIIYCLSCKYNLISWITGISYERLNWLHRWSAITMFFTVIVHWSWFFQEWKHGGIVEMEMDMMPMVRYGFVAWGVLGWMSLTSFGYFRQLAYEFFVLQHILGAFIFLWLVYTHMPSYARYNIWIATGFVVLDWTVRLFAFAWRNLLSHQVGHRAIMEQLPGKAVQLVIKDVKIRWKAGQHIYLYIPFVRLFENHPFTIANSCVPAGNEESSEMRFVIRAYSGFSRSLAKSLQGNNPEQSKELRAFILGPFGKPPALKYYDVIVLIASGAGATFTIPILEDLLAAPGPVRRIDFQWIVHSHDEISWFHGQLVALLRKPRNPQAKLAIKIFVTHMSSSVDKPELFKPISSNSSDSSLEPADLEAQNRVDEVAPIDNRNHLSTAFGRRPGLAELILPERSMH